MGQTWVAAFTALLAGLALGAQTRASDVQASAQPPAQPPAVVKLRQSPAGTTVLDAAGLTLYTSDGDAETSACVDACAKLWPPLVVAADVKLSAPWSAIVRPDGTHQLAFGGKPLYHHKDDAAAGSRRGEGTGLGGWKIAFTPAALPGGFSVQRALAGWMLADAAGHTVYARAATRKKDPPAEAWHVVAAPALAQPREGFTIIDRDDGFRQWARDGQALYTAVADLKSGDVRGAHPDLKPVVLEPIPAMPPWVTVQVSDTGEVLADGQGMTLYLVRSMAQVERDQTCLAACMAANWRTVPAAADATPVGNWSIVEDNGQKVWAYLGNVLFTHTRDKKAGDTMGYGFGAGHGIGGGWRPVMLTSLLPSS